MKDDERAVRVTDGHYGLSLPRYGDRSPAHSAVSMQRAAEGLRERFPWVQCWWGSHTRRWWAYVPGVGRLIEAGGPEQLSEEILRALGRPWR